ncbi:hypothetical protein RB195_009061 [Necator americanus]|uniref:Uncharacterized protein n=1 Tax=Necator americanus TaxID=51031 RepID=A0ABR1CU57_NECAM
MKAVHIRLLRDFNGTSTMGESRSFHSNPQSANHSPNSSFGFDASSGQVLISNLSEVTKSEKVRDTHYASGMVQQRERLMPFMDVFATRTAPHDQSLTGAGALLPASWRIGCRLPLELRPLVARAI